MQFNYSVVSKPKVRMISEKIYYCSLNSFYPLKSVLKNNSSKIFGESLFEVV